MTLKELGLLIIVAVFAFGVAIPWIAKTVVTVTVIGLILWWTRSWWKKVYTWTTKS